MRTYRITGYIELTIELKNVEGTKTRDVEVDVDSYHIDIYIQPSVLPIEPKQGPMIFELSFEAEVEALDEGHAEELVTREIKNHIYVSEGEVEDVRVEIEEIELIDEYSYFPDEEEM